MSSLSPHSASTPSLRETPSILVVGGGLSGLVSARALTMQGARVVLVEARDQLGGRIRGTDHGIDLGPAWLWPAVNPRLTSLVSDLGLETFSQYVQGAGIYEGPTGRVRIPTYEQGSMRPKGGMTALIDALVDELGAVDIRRATDLARLELMDSGVGADLGSADGRNARDRLDVDAVVLAAPPRVLHDTIAFEPSLPSDVAARWATTPTWMAGHAKFVARYETPFWRELGWSGMASSQVGPLVEVHDASPHGGPDGALFGFVGVPAPGRRSLGGEALIAASIAQLERLFGEQAGRPLATRLMDWAEEPWTARAADREGFGDHPDPQPSVVPGPWTARLGLAGSEFSSTVPGYLEGAVQAAEAAVAHVMASSAE